MKTKEKIISACFAAAMLVFARTAQAVCPVCTVAVGAGVGLSRWFGIDDAVTGLWIGGFIVSLIIWTLDWLNKQNRHFLFRDATVAIGYFLLAIVPLYYARIIAHPYAFLCSCAHDKLILGIASGSIGFYFGAVLYEYLKEHHGGHAYFPFQKVVMPIILLIILTILFYFLTK